MLSDRQNPAVNAFTEQSDRCFYRKYNAVITYRNVPSNIMGTIAPILFVISLENLFFITGSEPIIFSAADSRLASNAVLSSLFDGAPPSDYIPLAGRTV